MWQQYDEAQKMAESEAAHVEELYQLAGSLSEPERGRIQDLAASYARVVVEEEWPMMQRGRTSPRAGEIADELQRSIQDIEPRTEAEQALQSEGLTQVDELWMRSARSGCSKFARAFPHTVGRPGRWGCDHGSLHLTSSGWRLPGCTCWRSPR